jgi:hypothetical protein
LPQAVLAVEQVSQCQAAKVVAQVVLEERLVAVAVEHIM